MVAVAVTAGITTVVCLFGNNILEEGYAVVAPVFEPEEAYPCAAGSGPIVFVPDETIPGNYRFYDPGEEWRAYCKIRYAILDLIERKESDTPLVLPVNHQMWVPGVTPRVGDWFLPTQSWIVSPEHCTEKLNGANWSEGLSLCTFLLLANSNTAFTTNGEPVIRRVPGGYDLVLHTDTLDAFSIKWTVWRG